VGSVSARKTRSGSAFSKIWIRVVENMAIGSPVYWSFVWGSTSSPGGNWRICWRHHRNRRRSERCHISRRAPEKWFGVLEEIRLAARKRKDGSGKTARGREHAAPPRMHFQVCQYLRSHPRQVGAERANSPDRGPGAPHPPPRRVWALASKIGLSPGS